MARRRIFILLLLSVLGTAGMAALLILGARLPATAELSASDFIARHGRRLPADPKLIFLAIDSASMLDAEADLPDFSEGLAPSDPSARALRLMSAQWPWPRSIYALILDRLVGAGAKAVVFDLNFPTPSADDAEFREALRRHRERVVIGSNFVAETRREGEQPAVAHIRPTETLIPQEGPGDDRVGFVNLWPEPDGVVRAARFTVTEAELNDHRADGEERHFSLAARAVRKLGHASLGPRDSGPRWLRFAPAGGYPRRSMYEIFAPKFWRANCGSGALFRDAVVVVGAAGNWQHDEHLTTLGLLPGPEIQLNAIGAALHGGFIRQASPAEALGCLAAAGLLTALGAWLSASPLLRLGLLAGLGLAWVAGAFFLYDRAGFLLPTAVPLLTLLLNGALGFLYDFAVTRHERRRVRSTLERYVSRNVVRELIDNPREYHQSLGGVVRPVTILFSDIRNFTRLCANTDPEALVLQLNEYLTAMVECVFAHGGTLDKFIGDAVMAVWGNAHTDGPAEDARQALRCALAMRVALTRLNARWNATGRLPVEIGIALNHGRVVAGNIGSPHRMEFSVIGDAVNVCWRLQERTKLHGGALLLGESMVPLLGREFATAPVDFVTVGETICVRYARLVEAGERAVEAGALARSA